jgi:hypothetical protein
LKQFEEKFSATTKELLFLIMNRLNSCKYTLLFAMSLLAFLSLPFKNQHSILKDFENRRKNNKLINYNTFCIFYGIALANNTAADMVKMLLYSKQHSNILIGAGQRDVYVKENFEVIGTGGEE